MTPPLDVIGDIANPTLTDNTAEVITWETAADWDNSVDEAGVVHEAYGDLQGDGVLQMGYPSFDRGGSALTHFYPMYEDSGSTLNDVANGNDGTIVSADYGEAGLHNQGALRFGEGGSSDEASWPADQNGFPLSFACWYQSTNEPSDFPNLIGDADASDYVGLAIQNSQGDMGGQIGDGGGTGSGNRRSFSGTINEDEHDGNWHFIGASFNGFNQGDVLVYIDSSEYAFSPSGSASSIGYANGGVIAHRGAGNDYLQGSNICMVRVYSRILSTAEFQALYDAGTAGHLETATKSYNIASQPDLSGLDYTLNSQSITVDVIGSPGTASEEIVSQSLDGATSYSLSWSDTHTDFRLKVNFSTTDETVSPTVNSLSLST